MAEYLIQSETLTDIANQIRSRTGDTAPISPTDMGRQVQLVYAKGYINGKDAITEGEARTASDVYTPVEVDARSVEVTVTQGYYATEVVKNVDVQNVYDAGHTEGYTEGYEEGLAAGGGGDEPYDPTTVWQINDGVPVVTVSNIYATFISNGEEFVRINHAMLSLRYYRSDGTNVQAWGNRNGWDTAYQTITFPEEITDEDLITWLDTNATLIGSGGGEQENELEEMLISTDENYDDEGKQFYSVYKWLDVYNSSLSSAPVIITVMNNHPTLWMHAYIRVADGAGEYYYYSIAMEPDQGENSIELDFAVAHFTIEGVRWSKNGI